ncbi:DUF1513 domain-containing protein [Pusillimonas minor]|uniref:DUF1513 domain-containing protein n=1 Tax=Pusillimonas minor TaxID=2697024 RepID=A0A842HP99_9BURK|nr:DUF1513 domain-containing protein [Pusillimonas minor]MBC2768735.1 DUF1513 domain-containing protein [Pusillimonas minor]
MSTIERRLFLKRMLGAGLWGGSLVWAPAYARTVSLGAVAQGQRQGYGQGQEPASGLELPPSDLGGAKSALGDGMYLAARRRGVQHEIAVFDASGQAVKTVPIPDRGHSFAIDANRGRVVAFGRQPGYFAVPFTLDDNDSPPTEITSAPGRHFFGHGVFSPDGDVLAATENDYDGGRGVIGLYQPNGQGQWPRVGEWSTHGIGPHEMILMPDGRTVCVANGGLLTHPDYGKLILNRDSMQPSLAYIDLQTGKLLEQVFVPQPWQQLSIRHLALDGNGVVWFGGQYAGPATHTPPLVGYHQRGQALSFANPGSSASGHWRPLNNYVGSLACDESGRLIATTSPVGGVAMFWDATKRTAVGATPLFDGCGVAQAPGGGFLISSGAGQLCHVSLAGPGQVGGASPSINIRSISSDADVSWDNHMRRV